MRCVSSAKAGLRRRRPARVKAALSVHERSPLTLSWNYWLWAVQAQAHNLLKATFRERRGVVQLHAVPPAVLFALLNHFARPRPHLNKDAVYKQGHATWTQGTSKGGAYHFIKFSYNEMDHCTWAFNLGDLYDKTCADSTRIVTNGRLSDARLWGTPVQFKLKWAVQQQLGEATYGVNTFTVSANITHVGLRADAPPRYNLEYGRWVAELQQEHLVAVKKAVLKFPVRPFSRKHKLFGVVHPLHEWANTPTPLPSMQQLEADEAEGDEAEGGDVVGEAAVACASLSDDDDDYDDDNCLSESSSSHD